ncbi:hypothetical protein Drorol1_Dr00025608 [Drosera rotundifolia]
MRRINEETSIRVFDLEEEKPENDVVDMASLNLLGLLKDDDTSLSMDEQLGLGVGCGRKDWCSIRVLMILSTKPSNSCGRVVVSWRKSFGSLNEVELSYRDGFVGDMGEEL